MLEYKYVALCGEKATDMQRYNDMQSAYHAYFQSQYAKRGVALSIYNTVTTEASTFKLFTVDGGNLLSQVARLNTEKLPQQVKDNIEWLKEAIKTENLAQAARKEAEKQEAHKIVYFKADEHPEINSEIVEKIPLTNEVKKDMELRVSRSGCVFGKSPFTDDFGYSFALVNGNREFKDYAADKSGDVIDYVQAKNKFPTREDAIKNIISEHPALFSNDVKEVVFSVEKRVEEINAEACSYYHNALEADEACKTYFKSRGFSDSTIEKYELGTSGKGFEQILRKHMKGIGYTDEELMLSGVISKSEKNGRYYDFFHDRALIPIKNENGNVVGFGGRTLVDDAAKYKNTRTTPCFQKSNVLFNMNVAKKSMQKNLLVVEGFMDCISAYQSGFDNVIAGCGTAFTDQYIDIIKKTNKGVVLCYDNDEAGQRALASVSQRLKEQGVQVYSLDMSALKSFIGDESKPCKDFNDLLMAKGPKGLQEFLKSQNAPVSLFDYRIDVPTKEAAVALRKKLNECRIPYKAGFIEKTQSYAFKIDERHKERVNGLLEKKTSNEIENLPREKAFFIEAVSGEAEKIEGLLTKNGIKSAKTTPKNYNDKVIFKISLKDKPKYLELKALLKSAQVTPGLGMTC